VVEGGLFLGAVAAYAHGRPVVRGFRVLVAALLVLYVGNLFGPPPPGVTAVVGSILLMAPLAWWAGNRVGAPAP
jgi:hypothetical protein